MEKKFVITHVKAEYNFKLLFLFSVLENLNLRFLTSPLSPASIPR